MRKLPRKHQRVYDEWSRNMDSGPLSSATAVCYKTDVARFLRFVDTRSLENATTEKSLRCFLYTLSVRSRSRMVSALSEFLAFTNRGGETHGDPLRRLKYRRDKNVSEKQLDFFDLLAAEGLSRDSIRNLQWADFVAPLLQRRGSCLRVGHRTVKVHRASWQYLDDKFRELLIHSDIATLLEERIA